MTCTFKRRDSSNFFRTALSGPPRPNRELAQDFEATTLDHIASLDQTAQEISVPDISTIVGKSESLVSVLQYQLDELLNHFKTGGYKTEAGAYFFESVHPNIDGFICLYFTITTEPFLIMDIQCRNQISGFFYWCETWYAT